MKTGLDYFPLDIDFFEDEKIEFVSALFGVEGELTTIKLLARIYRHGYYIEWNEDQALLFAKRTGVKIEIVKGVIGELLKRNFLNKNLLSKYQILTSNGIQRRYFEAAKRRKIVDVQKEYLLMNVINLPENVNILEEKEHIFQQSKESKESKESKDRAREVVEYLNEKTGKNFKPEAEANIESINARITDGYTVDDLKQVIDNMTIKWLDRPDMVEYLRPRTLFAPKKFESYLNAVPNKDPTPEVKLPTIWNGFSDLEIGESLDHPSNAKKIIKVGVSQFRYENDPSNTVYQIKLE